MAELMQQGMPAPILSLREKIGQWRKERQGRRMPAELWAEAVSLARRYGVQTVSRHAGVHYTRLKTLLRQDAPREVRFVEVSPAGRAVGAFESRLEIVRPDGCRLQVSRPTPQIAAEMTAMFLGFRR